MGLIHLNVSNVSRQWVWIWVSVCVRVCICFYFFVFSSFTHIEHTFEFHLRATGCLNAAKWPKSTISTANIVIVVIVVVKVFNCLHNEWDRQSGQSEKGRPINWGEAILSRRPMLQFRLWSVWVCVRVSLCFNLKIKFLGWICVNIVLIHRTHFGIRDDEIVFCRFQFNAYCRFLVAFPLAQVILCSFFLSLALPLPLFPSFPSYFFATVSQPASQPTIYLSIEKIHLHLKLLYIYHTYT